MAFAFATIDFGGGWHVSDSSCLPPGWRVSVAPHPTALLVLRLHDPVPWHDEVGYREHDQPAVLSIEGMRDAYVRICAAAWDEYRRANAPLRVLGPDGQPIGMAADEDELRALITAAFAGREDT